MIDRNIDRLLGARPTALMTSYHTRDSVEEQKDGFLIGRLYMHVRAVQGRYPISNPLIFSCTKHTVYVTGAACNNTPLLKILSIPHRALRLP